MSHLWPVRPWIQDLGVKPGIRLPQCFVCKVRLNAWWITDISGFVTPTAAATDVLGSKFWSAHNIMSDNYWSSFLAFEAVLIKTVLSAKIAQILFGNVICLEILKQRSNFWNYVMEVILQLGLRKQSMLVWTGLNWLGRDTKDSLLWTHKYTFVFDKRWKLLD